MTPNGTVRHLYSATHRRRPAARRRRRPRCGGVHHAGGPARRRRALPRARNAALGRTARCAARGRRPGDRRPRIASGRDPHHRAAPRAARSAAGRPLPPAERRPQPQHRHVRGPRPYGLEPRRHRNGVRGPRPHHGDAEREERRAPAPERSLPRRRCPRRARRPRSFTAPLAAGMTRCRIAVGSPRGAWHRPERRSAAHHPDDQQQSSRHERPLVRPMTAAATTPTAHDVDTPSSGSARPCRPAGNRVACAIHVADRRGTGA